LSNLTGRWKAVVADEALRRTYPEVDFDDAAWGDLEVPGHWRSSPDFADTDGPLLARHRFETPDPGDDGHDDAGRRRWLTFDGVFYQSDVWLDGSYLGDTEGYFFPHTFEVTEQLGDRREHVLATELTCSPQRDRTAKRNLTGVFQHWDCFDPDWNPGGIWRPVRLHDTGPVRIHRLRVHCAEATSTLAILSVRAILDAAEGTTVQLRTIVDGGRVDTVEERTLAAGENRVEWRVGVEDPPLWWPHALGDPTLVDVTVEARLLDRAAPSDARTLRTGLRKVALDHWIASINGERLFLKGANQGPTRMALAEATPEELRRDVELAKAANLDLLRVHAHVTRPELYEAADEAGLLLWQDLPLQWGYARGTRKQAVRQAREAVDLLGHHPSIAIWCGHNEPLTIDVEPGSASDDKALKKIARRTVRGMVLPSWNKNVLDSSLRRALAKADKSRPVIAHSGIPTGDSHLYFGWYHGDERDLPGALSAWPRLARFVSEFGAQAVPSEGGDDFLDPAAWPDLDWPRLGRHHALQRTFFERHGLDPDDFATFDAWRTATQAYQAELVRRHVETLRRLKYRPAGGFAQFCFADGHPAVTWSVLDHERRPKAGLAALTEACAPVIVVADRLDATSRPGDTVALDVHVVSDRREPLTGLTVGARLSWSGGEHERAWTGDVPADACVRIGTLQFVVPDAPGPLALDLSCQGSGVDVTNRYEGTITG
jgi:beta-mannosidase